MENEIDKLPDKVAEKLLHLGPNEEKPHIVTPENGEASELNEKEPAAAPNGEDHPQQRPALDVNTATEQQRPRTQEAPSPVYSLGDTPFPTVDNSQNKFLDSESLANNGKRRERRTTFSTLEKAPSRETNSNSQAAAPVGSVKRRRRATTKGSRRGFTIEDMPSRADAEELMNMAQGHLVQFPYDWLLTEEHNGNWGYQVDGVAPLAI